MGFERGVRRRSAGVSYPLKQQVLDVIDAKLSGQKRLDARSYIFRSADDHGAQNLIKRLGALPDTDTDHELLAEPRQYELWRADRAAGMSYQAIANKYDQPYSRVYRIVRSIEVVTPRPRSDKGTTHQRKEQPIMASRKSDSLQLLERVRAVDWPINKTTDGFRIELPDGKKYDLHLANSDGNAINAALQALQKAGLAEAERDKELERERDRKAKIAADREAAELATQRALARAATHKTARVRAAGDYLVEPETMPLAWFTTPHPAPQMRWVWMTRPVAEYLLKHHNKPGSPKEPGTNRPQSETTIRHYASVIAADKWRLTHQGMAMDSAAVLQDGQHRLCAMLLASELLDDDVRLPVAFFVGMDPDNFKAIDEGLLRTAAQLFTMEGQKNATTLKSAIRLVIAHTESPENARNVLRRRNTNAQMLDAFARNPEAFQVAASVAQARTRKWENGMNPGPYAALHYLLHIANGTDNRFLDAFFHGISTGTKMGLRELDGGEKYQLGLLGDDPRLVLRQTLAAIKVRQQGRSASAMDQLGLGILAWNNLAEGRHRQQIKWQRDTEIPRVIICKDDVGSIPPRALIGEVEPRQLDEIDTEDDTDE